MWTRVALNTNKNAVMVRKRLAFYPPDIVSRFVYHSLRDGFFVNGTIQSGKNHNWDIHPTMRMMCYLGDWSYKTDPNKFYDNEGMITRHIDLTAVSRGDKRNMYRSERELTPAYYHQLPREVRRASSHQCERLMLTPPRNLKPMFFDNEEFWEEQVELTRMFLRRVVWCAIKCSREHEGFRSDEFPRHPEWNGVPGRDPLIKEDAIDAALAYFVFKQYNEGRTTEQLGDYQRFQANRAALAAAAELHFTRTLYPQHVHTKMDFLVQVHVSVCIPILTWEGYPNFPLMG